ncbi:beta-ketoacyl synthase N-terminal-like domain-containing protein [Gracilibacillus sp. JCM 18860]|uniref:beta-ketoacyl synthase N-terminal-like domain-containing protein n=1 Tax=Gracilibacillus sp. JCM 18860 TaxID=1306159 RepID=UPI0006CF9E24
MDPQQRLFLEESWKAMENAGYVGESVKGRKCGIYVGCGGGGIIPPYLWTHLHPPKRCGEH